MITVIISDNDFDYEGDIIEYPENNLKLREIKPFIENLCKRGDDIAILTRSYFIICEFSFYDNVRYLSPLTNNEMEENKDVYKLDNNFIFDYFEDLYCREQDKFYEGGENE